MAQILKLRRSSVSGQKPTNDNLQLGELAVNTTDGKIFLAKSGSLGPTIEEIVTTNTINTGSINLIGGITVSGDISGSNIKASSFIKSGGKNTEYLMADGGVSTLTNPITGSGNPNYIPKFSGSGTIGNSQIFDNGTGVGIGTTIPNSRLDVNGNTTLSGSLMVSQSLIQYSSVTSVPSGSVTDVMSFNTGSYTAAFFDFVITSGSNSRAGTIFTTWNGNNIEYTETSTNDIGNTTSLQLSTSLSAGSVKLRATSIMGSWSVKTLARMI